MKKKWILLVFSLLLLLITFSSLVFISDKLKVGGYAEAAINYKGPTRYLQDTSNWKKWWPDTQLFTYKGVQFLFDKTIAGITPFKLLHKGDSLTGSIQILAVTPHLSKVVWRTEVQSTNNPIKKWLAYFKARKIKSVLGQLASILSSHFTTRNVYGIEIKHEKVKDSVLIATRSFFNHYPSVAEISAMIEKLRSYIKNQNAIEKSNPMMHVHQHADNNFETLVALATDRLLPLTNEFEPKRVLKGGNILEAEYIGGPVKAAELFQRLEEYKTDIGLTSAAIPYQSLITDRQKEADTSKWVTRFYYPFF